MKYVAYYRVSTQRQGQSGLGLEAQQFAVRNFLHNQGTITAEFIEVESGKNNERPQLQKAMQKAKEESARLVIAKLDRLSRNASFIFLLRDSGVDFICADMPDANSLTIGIFAVIAQNEREVISQRTRAALQAKKAQGHTLGNSNNFSMEGRNKGLQAIKENARTNKNNMQAQAIALMCREKGMTLRQIADRLNELGYTTRRQCKFFPATVQHLLRQTKKSI